MGEGASESHWVLKVGFSEGKIFELRPKWQDLEIHISVKNYDKVSAIQNTRFLSSF